MAKKIWRRLSILRDWRRIVLLAAKIIKETYPESEIYIVGGAVEDRLTVNSDIDLAVVFEEQIGWSRMAEILENIWRHLDERIPIYYPLHIIITNQNELKRIKGMKKKIS